MSAAIVILCAVAIIAAVWIFARRKAPRPSDTSTPDAPTVGTNAAGGRRR
jgi:hypothetical protein